MNKIPAGYKKTEVGIIPEDWEIKRLGEIVNFLDGQRRPIKNSDRAKIRGQYPYYGASGIIDYVNDYIFNDELILLGEDGENILSRNLRLVFKVKGKIWVNNHAHVLKPKDDYDIDYLSEKLESLDYEQLNTGTAQPKLNQKTCWQIPVACPPTKAEQTAIATALNDADALITQLEKLIAKKRLIKQGAMQQLLTGKKRLAGFDRHPDGRPKGHKQTELGPIPEDWETIYIGDLVKSLEAGISVNSVEKDNGAFAHGLSVLKTSCVIGGKFIPEEHKAIIPRDIFRAKLNPRQNSIIISRMNTPALVGECGYVERDYPKLFLPDRLWMMRHDNRFPHDVRWLAYLLSFSAFNRVIKESATGTSGSMKNISKASLFAVLIPFPHHAEQEAISQALADMDSEIDALEASSLSGI